MSDTEKFCEDKRGNKFHQKLKPYMVLQYLLRHSDEEHVVTAPDIAAALDITYGIHAERRSIYRDIHEINLVALMLEQGINLEEANKLLAEDEDDELKLVVRDRHRKGFYVAKRTHDFYQYQLLAECVYAAKFLSKREAHNLVEVICGMLSEHQAARIIRQVETLDRTRTNNKHTIAAYMVIEDAMSTVIDGEPHVPEKIRFKYLKYELGALDKQVERRKGDCYVVSPFKLIMNEGNCYLMAVNEKGKLINYRLDRMRNIQLTGEPREGADVFAEVKLATYSRRVFNMYRGEEQRVLIRFIPPLLDTMVERFGTGDGTLYYRYDDRHLAVRTTVEVSDQFYGWLLGFGKRVKLMEASGSAVEDFRAYLKKISAMYE